MGIRGVSHIDAEPAEGPIRLLHVDDEPDFADLTATYLQRELDAVSVTTEHTVADGLARLDDADFDCIVSDYQMPGGDGLEFLADVRDRFPDLPFILFTGQGSEEVASEAISAGVTEYLQKGGGTDQFAVLANRIANAVDHYRSRRALEASEARLSLFFKQSPLGVIEWDEAFEFVRMNRKAEQILGYTPSDLAEDGWETFVTDRAMTQVSAVVERLTEAKGGYQSINENVTKDGERIICEWHNRVVTDDHGDVVAIFTQFQDVTEREEHKRRLETLIQNLPGIVYRCRNEPGWPFEFVSGECVGVTGYQAATLESDEIDYAEDVVHPEDRAALEATIEAALADDEPFEHTYRIRTNEGERRWVWERGRAIRSSDGEIEALEGFIRDITPRKEIEERLERRARAMDAAPMGIVITDPNQDDNPIVYANEQFQRLTGYDEAEILGRNCRFLQGEDTDDAPVEEMREKIDAREPVAVELRNYRKDGSTFWNRVTVEPVENDAGEVTHFVGFQRDIIERKNGG